MTIWRQQLKRLQADPGHHNNGHNKQYAIGISQREGKSHQRKGSEMLKVRAGKRWTRAERRQCREDDESERQPACDGGYPLNHGC